MTGRSSPSAPTGVVQGVPMNHGSIHRLIYGAHKAAPAFVGVNRQLKEWSETLTYQTPCSPSNTRQSIYTQHMNLEQEQ